MHKSMILMAAMGLSSCTDFGVALESLSRELDDGIFIVRSSLEAEGIGFREPGEVYHIVRLAEDRTGSPARFEAISTETLLSVSDPILESDLSVSPDGNFIAYFNLEDQNGVGEYNLRVFEFETNRTIYSGTDDILASTIRSTCGFDSILGDQVRASLDGYDGNSSLSISYIETGFGIEWPMSIAGWTPQNNAVFEIDVYMDWRAEWTTQDGIDLDQEGENLNATTYVTFDTQGPSGDMSVLECAGTAPADMIVRRDYIYEVTGDADQTFSIDGAQVQTFLRPDAPFRVPRAVSPVVVTGVFVPQ